MFQHRELRRWLSLLVLKISIFVRELAGGVLSFAAVPGGLCSLVRELAGGVLSSAAVLRGGLGPPTPPLCRCAEYTACQLL
jgi:hypothetical protein